MCPSSTTIFCSVVEDVLGGYYSADMMGTQVRGDTFQLGSP